MALGRSKEEKVQFFRDLSRLDDFVDEEQDRDEDELEVAQFSHRSLIKTSRQSYYGKPLETRVISSDDSERSLAPFRSSVAPESLKPRSFTAGGKRKRRSSRSSPKPALRSAKTAPLQTPPASSPVRSFEGAVSIPLRRVQSDLDIAMPKKRKGDKKLEEIPQERQIFQGLTFFFVPPNDDNPTRRFRIRKSIQYGAVWARKCSSDVTHIIVCDGLNAETLIRYFKGNSIPADPVLVRDQWLVESIKSRFLRETHWQRFQVEGLSVTEHQTSSQASRQDEPDADFYANDGEGRASQAHADGMRTMSLSTNRTSKVVNEISSVDRLADMTAELRNALEDVKALKNLDFSPSFNDDSNSKTESGDDDPALTMLITNDKIQKENQGFQCMERYHGDDKNNPNHRTIEILQQMASYYDRVGDHWRTTAYRKAISALKKQREHIRTKEQALAIPMIGERLAEKIGEIVATDRLRRLEETTKDPYDQILQLFMGIYGVGYSTAVRWIAQGHRNFQDLRLRANLSHSQRIGIDHYDDFLQRIPRAEVEQHGAMVKKALKAADPGLQGIIGGSYRRGASDSSDIDLIITKRDATLEHIRTLLVEVVIPDLTTQGFLKAALAVGGRHETSSKWHGASALPGSTTWRRIDLLFVPWDELGAALIYFTGNDIFNRSLRLLASRKNMRLNQRGLYRDVMRGRGREKVTDGNLLEGHDEKRIFDILGVPYRPPEHRQC